MHFVYVLWDKDNKKFYIGYTANLERRMSEHKEGQCHTTLRMQDIDLLFYEAFLSREDACRREDYFKTTKGKKVLRLMLRESLK